MSEVLRNDMLRSLSLLLILVPADALSRSHTHVAMPSALRAHHVPSRQQPKPTWARLRGGDVQHATAQSRRGVDAPPLVASKTSLVATEEPKGTISYRRAMTATVWSFVATAVFGVGVVLPLRGATGCANFFTAFLVEKSLSVDNLFVFLMIFEYFEVPEPYTQRVLRWGILSALVLRGIMIAAGVMIINRFKPGHPRPPTARTSFCPMLPTVLLSHPHPHPTPGSPSPSPSPAPQSSLSSPSFSLSPLSRCYSQRRNTRACMTTPSSGSPTGSLTPQARPTPHRMLLHVAACCCMSPHLVASH